ncbi:MAG: hypothetical protein Q7T57_04605, partial [Dehalococcoidales bacterium]|nr:hypothetical protein [Dehalococcoidales bacterium]
MTKPVGFLTNSLTGLEGEPGVFYNYVLAANGLFLKAKNAHLAATVCIAPQLVRGLAPMEENIQLLHGKIPTELLSLALSVLCIKPDIEQYLAIIWNEGYTIKIPTQTGTPGSVNYETLDNKVLDIHSHTGSMPAEFSMVDNHDEQGFGIYAVVGDLRSLFPTVELRLGVYAYFMPLEKSEV